MSVSYIGFTVTNGDGEVLSANDEGYSSEKDNALEISTHFTVFSTRDEAADFLIALTNFRAAEGYDSLGPYTIDELVLSWV